MLHKSPRKTLYEKSAAHLVNAFDGLASLSRYKDVVTDYEDDLSDILDVNDSADGEEGDDEGDEAEEEEEEESPYWVKLHDSPDSYQCLIGDCKKILTHRRNVSRHIGNVHKSVVGAQRARAGVRTGGKEDERWRKTGDGKWECTVCENRLATKHGVQRHLAARHPGELSRAKEDEGELDEDGESAPGPLSIFSVLINPDKPSAPRTLRGSSTTAKPKPRRLRPGGTTFSSHCIRVI